MIVGMDCGGTGTTAVAYKNGNVLATVNGGVGNLKRIGYVEAVYLVVSLCAELRNIVSEPTEAISIGIAGAGKYGERDQLRSLIAETMKLPVRVETDAAIALHGAFDGGPGMLLIAGTGSIAYGKSSDSSEPLRVGGWGWQLGDEGSGCWLGREAIRCCLLAHDGRGEKTELTEKINTHFDIQSIVDSVPIIYSTEWTPAKYGELAPLVLETAKTDPVAKKLVRLASNHLVRHLTVLQDRLGGEQAVRQVAFSGGLLSNETALYQELLIEIEHIGTMEVVQSMYPPAVGAARLIEAK